jgi:hypothetical protein
VLVDTPAVLSDDNVESRPNVVHHVGDELGIHAFRHGGEPTHIGEQHRDLSTPLDAGVDGRQLATQRVNCDVHHLVGHDAAQRLLRRYGQLELMSIGHQTLPGTVHAVGPDRRPRRPARPPTRRRTRTR